MACSDICSFYGLEGALEANLNLALSVHPPTGEQYEELFENSDLGKFVLRDKREMTDPQFLEGPCLGMQRDELVEIRERWNKVQLHCV